MTKLPMPSKELIQEQLERKLSEKDDGTIVKKLDGDDTVRLENYILKQHVEQLTRQLEDSRREEFERTIKRVRQDYETYLVEKYEVDTELFKIAVDAQRYTLSIIPLEE